MVMWMVRSGRGGRWIEEFLSRSVVGLGWHGVKDSTSYQTKAALLSAMQTAYPEMSEGTAASGAGQLWRFRKELAIDDKVVTYDSGSRNYYVGTILGEATYVPDEIEEMTLQRLVSWSKEGISRDRLSADAKNRLGSTLTLFKVPQSTELELSAIVSGNRVIVGTVKGSDEEAVDPFGNIDEEARLRIADRISALDWAAMQRLVAAMLRAMGYRTEISPIGPDRGKDILASPDGFGFEQPRIAVEVKHRPGEKMDAPAIRSFVGGRHKDDRGLYVSTGGFTKDAYYEADRSNIPLKLLTLDDLAKAVIENYGAFDSEGRALLPLTTVYWPA